MKNLQIKDQEEENIDNCQQPLLDTVEKMDVVKSVLHDSSVRISPLTPSTTNEINGVVKHNGIKHADEEDQNNPDVPRDRYNLVFIILVIHGIGILMPWNMFINATDYFTKHKLTTIYPNGKEEASVYKEYFLSYLGYAAQVPNVLFSLINTFFFVGGNNFTIRIIGSIVIEIVIIVITIVLAIMDTSSWTSTFFYATMSCVVMLNIANGVYQNSLYGLASKLPMRYSNAVVLGCNISGTFTSLVNIVSIWVSPNLRIAVVYYFVSALFILLVGFDTYLALPINRFFRYYVMDERFKDLVAEKGLDKSSDNNLISKTQRPEYLLVFRYAWKQCLNVFLVFFVTISIFPAIHASIKPNDPEYFGTLESTDLYFNAVCCFLIFNTCAMLGNIIPNYIQIPGPDKLWIPVVARFLLIPFFLFCNLNPEIRSWPVYIQSDTLFVFGGIILGLSSGYLCSLCMMYAPKSVPSEHAGTAGMMAAASLVTGVFFGVNFSLFLLWFIKI